MLNNNNSYKARLEDLQIGQTLYQKINQNWSPLVITREDYFMQPTGQNNLSIIINDITRFEKKEMEIYRIKLLDENDFLLLGFYKVESKDPNLPYVNFTNDKFLIEFHKKNKRVDIFEIHVKVNKDITAILEKDKEQIFTGQILNALELTNILQSTGVMFTPTRKELFQTTQEQE